MTNMIRTIDNDDNNSMKNYNLRRRRWNAQANAKNKALYNDQSLISYPKLVHFSSSLIFYVNDDDDEGTDDKKT